MKTDNHARLALVAAVLVGLFAVVAVNKYISRKTTVAPAPTASILVATAEIKEGMEIGEEMLGSAEIPFESLSNIHIALPAKNDPDYPKALSDAMEKIVGRRAKRLIAAKTPVFWIDIDTEPKTPFADLIADGCRAVTVPVDSVSSVCGFIKPGSRIDVVLTASEEKLGLVTGQAAKEAGAKVVSSVILQNVPVIATDRQYDLQSEPSGYGTMTLSLPLKAAIMMVQARTMGQITYLLRNVRDTKTEQDRATVTVSPGAAFGETVRMFQ
jgi:pilus assembly protein CpaB